MLWAAPHFAVATSTLLVGLAVGCTSPPRALSAPVESRPPDVPVVSPARETIVPDDDRPALANEAWRLFFEDPPQIAEATRLVQRLGVGALREYAFPKTLCR